MTPEGIEPSTYGLRVRSLHDHLTLGCGQNVIVFFTLFTIFADC